MDMMTVKLLLRREQGIQAEFYMDFLKIAAIMRKRLSVFYF